MEPEQQADDHRPDRGSGNDHAPFDARRDELADDDRGGRRADAEPEVEQVQRAARPPAEEVEDEPVHASIDDAGAEPAGAAAMRKMVQVGAVASSTRPTPMSTAAIDSTGRRPTRSVTRPPPNEPQA